MTKSYDLLILGADSDIGQSIIRLINDRFHYIECAVPTKKYRAGAILPSNQIALVFSNHSLLEEDIKQFEVVVSCSPKYSSNTIKSICEKAKTKFIDGCCSYPEAVIASAFLRLPFKPMSMEASQSAHGFSFFDFWTISHNESSLPFPKKVNSIWCIDQESVSLEGFSVSHRLEFKSRFSAFFAFFFWIMALISRVIYPFFKKGKAYRSLSNWTFHGKCYEHNQKYRFKATAERVDAELLRPDIAMFRIIECLDIDRKYKLEWRPCEKLKVKLVEYNIQPN